jgi:glycosyltransferase involved in cell wall biosynthesis
MVSRSRGLVGSPPAPVPPDEAAATPSILFLSWKDLAHPEAGGSEIFVDCLIDELRGRGHRVGLVCGGPVAARPYHIVESGGRYSQYLGAPLKARRMGQWDLLVEVVNGFPFLSPLWWRGPRLCFFHHVHEDQWFRHFPRLVAEVGWFVEGKVVPAVYRRTTFAALSASTASRLAELGVPRRSIHVVNVGLDQTLFDEAVNEPAGADFVCVGRLVANKGIDRVLAAWELVRPDVGGRLLLIGDGPLRSEIEARRIPGVEVLGRVDEQTKRRLVAVARLLVHGAYREGWGMVISEAGAMGTASLAFDAPGVRDAIVDGETGRLVSTVDEMAAAWRELARDPARLERMQGAARTRARELSWARAADQLLVAARQAGVGA